MGYSKIFGGHRCLHLEVNFPSSTYRAYPMLQGQIRPGWVHCLEWKSFRFRWFCWMELHVPHSRSPLSLVDIPFFELDLMLSEKRYEPIHGNEVESTPTVGGAVSSKKYKFVYHRPLSFLIKTSNFSHELLPSIRWIVFKPKTRQNLFFKNKLCVSNDNKVFFLRS